MWINGVYSAGTSGNVIEVRNPATEEVIFTPCKKTFD
jgi:acyl-CoA reductase-like NAD-dependent aldehyde dehydrogenase